MSHLQEIYTIKSQFSSAHFYHQTNWTDEKNRQFFGRCFTPYGHGHNYQLEVSFNLSQSKNKNENYLKTLEQQVQLITQELDHEHLNFTIPYFKNHIPTTENIALYLIEKLKSLRPDDEVKQLKLYEMSDLWVEVTP